jgi:hypothetical protein
LEIACPDRLDTGWVYEEYLSSDRFSIEEFPGEPGTVISACTSYERV